MLNCSSSLFTCIVLEILSVLPITPIHVYAKTSREVQFAEIRSLCSNNDAAADDDRLLSKACFFCCAKVCELPTVAWPTFLGGFFFPSRDDECDDKEKLSSIKEILQYTRNCSSSSTIEICLAAFFKFFKR